MGWQFWIDRGGTFTDVVARRPDGGLVTHKLLSDNPEQYRDAALEGIRRLLGVASGAPIPVESIDAVLRPDTKKGYLFFIAKGDGTGSSAFAKTQAEHDKNVAKYSKN